MSDNSDKIIARKEAGIGYLILNQPEKRNAISFAMWQSIGDAMVRFAKDSDVRVVIVSGAGDKAFSAGADISEFKALRSTSEGRRKYEDTMRRAFDLLYNLPKLTIAMINGVCIGGGAEVAMDCDVLVASDRSRFGITPARLGIGYRLPDVERLVRHVGAKRAKEILATARIYSAADALQMGWVNHVVPVGELTDYVESFAKTVATNAPLSVTAAKVAINEALKVASERDIELCDRLVDACYESEDYLEGRQAFAEKRTPNYKGR